MKKFLERLVMFVAAALSAVAPMSVSAATPVYVSNGSAIRITREVLGVSNAVNAEFTYSMAADDDNPAEISGLRNFTVKFENVTPENGTAKVNQAIDFSGITFPRVGDYYVHVNEIASSDEVNFPVDTDHHYTLVVSVRNSINAQNEPTGDIVAVVVNQVIDKNGDKTGSNEIVFNSTAARTSISLSKTVGGNNSNLEDYFKFQIDFADAQEGDVFVINGQDETVQYGGETVTTQTSFVVGETNYVYLKNGQSVVIGQNETTNMAEIPVGLRYTISELGAEDYITYIDGSTTDNKIAAQKVTSLSSDNATVFHNTKSASVATGVSTMIMPLALLAVLGIASTSVYLAISRKKK